MPDVQGDINRAPFRSGAFYEVYFEKVPYDAFSGSNVGAIREARRLLEPGGRLIVETGSAAPLTEIVAAMREVGFKYIRVTAKGYLRITARRGRT
jgi:hypothetical protein